MHLLAARSPTPLLQVLQLSPSNAPQGEQALHLLQVVAESDKLDPVEYAEKANAYFSGPYTGTRPQR